LLQRADRRGAVREGYVGGRAHELRGVRAQAGEIAGSPANVDLEIAALAPALAFQALPERADPGLYIPVAPGEIIQHRDATDTLSWLRACRDRPKKRRHCRRAGESQDERAALHSITSSARSRNGSGILRPSALAVLRLMTSSNLVGCSTGMSPGLAPRKILSTKSPAPSQLSPPARAACRS